MTLTHIPTRASLIARAKAIRDECQQIIWDAEHWNHIHPTEEPIDGDPDGDMRRIIDGIDAMLAKEAARSAP